MSDSSTPASGLPGLGDLFALLGTSNPLASVSRTIEQFKRGVNEFLVAVENFNETVQTINALAARVAIVMDEVEEPIRAMMPQITRSIRATDAMITQISGPIEKVAPGISRLAETLGSPVFVSMPNEIAGFLDTLGDVAARLQPLAQMAENAGSLFGLRPFASMRPNRPAPPAAPPVPAPVAQQPPAPAPAPAKTASARKVAPKKAAPSNAVAKKAGAKKAPATKAPAKRR